MQKRIIALSILAFVSLAAIIGFCWTFFATHEISLTEASLQSRIDAKMPFTTKKGVRVSQVQLNLPNDQIALSFEASVTKLKTEYNVAAQTQGTLMYDSSAGSFYFHPHTLKIDKMQANGKGVGEKVGSFIDKWVDSKKIVDNKQELMGLAEDATQVLVLNAAEHVLAHVPVYTLPQDLKGTAVRISLADVQVHDGVITAHLSLWQVTKTVVISIVSFLGCLAFAVLLLATPGWGKAAYFLP